MKNKITNFLLLLVVFSLALAGCGRQVVTPGPDEIPTALTSQAGKGTILGRLTPIPGQWNGSDVFAYAAPYLGDPDGEGVFVMDDTVLPKAKVDANGWYQIVDIPVGTYVMVFGLDSENALAYRKEGRAIRFDVKADVLTDVGELTLE